MGFHFYQRFVNTNLSTSDIVKSTNMEV